MKTTTQIDPLKSTLRGLPGNVANEIRTAYYQAAAALATLNETLQQANSDLGGNSPLKKEQLIAEEALDAFDRSQLGRYL